MLLQRKNSKRLRFIIFIYWVLLTYICAALIWWFVALNRQNSQMANYMRQEIKKDHPLFLQQIEEIDAFEKRKEAQFLGEGITFFLLILAGAAFIYRAVSRQFKQTSEHQHLMMAISHELKTPIAIAKLNLETIQKRRLDESQQNKLIQNTIYETDRLNDLCNNLLLSSQIESEGYQLTASEINFSELLQLCVMSFSVRFPQRVFNFSTEENLCVNGDQLLLQLAINNLLDNAVKYAPKELPIAIKLAKKGETLHMQIIDEGVGIESGEKNEVFKKYYRIGNAATKASKGTGLGLYLTKKIVLQHKGNIYITNNHPKGSIFNVELNLLN